MQPYFFPYIGYWQLIHAVDCFVLFDDVQYVRHGWINRNRILKPGDGWQGADLGAFAELDGIGHLHPGRHGRGLDWLGLVPEDAQGICRCSLT